MNTSFRKWLTWASLAIFFISLITLLIEGLLNIPDNNIFSTSLLILILSISIIVALISLRFEKNKIFRKTVIIISLLMPVYLFISLAPSSWIYVKSEIGTSLLIIGLILSSAAIAVYAFILSRPDSIAGLIIILSYLVLSLILKQIYKFADIEIIVFGFFMFGPGMVMFGIRSLFVLHKNNYLKILTCIVCLLIFLVSWEIIWINPDSKKTTLVVYSILIFLTTFIILLSLPVSGYVLWNNEHKRILKKLIIPWVFILFIVSVRFIFPDLSNVLFREKQNEAQEFGMRDYEIINKNGLDPE